MPVRVWAACRTRHRTQPTPPLHGSSHLHEMGDYGEDDGGVDDYGNDDFPDEVRGRNDQSGWRRW
jgi:hypothetical protein